MFWHCKHFCLRNREGSAFRIQYLQFPCPGRLSGNPAWSIAGFRVIANPPGVFHATNGWGRVSKKGGFIAWLKKRGGKGDPKINHLRDKKALSFHNGFCCHELMVNLDNKFLILNWKIFLLTILSAVVMQLEAISKIGFWLNIKAGPSFNPQTC